MELLADRASGSSSATSAARGHGASSGTGLHAPPAIARVSPGNIRSLILEKEKELHDINEYRIHTLEALLREKESAAQAYKQKFSKLQEDFKYNLKLLEGRDEELALYDTNFASLKSVLRDREAEISELKAQLADVQGDLKQEQKRASEQEAYFQQKLKDARAQMEGARWNFDDELRRVRDEMEASKRKTERQMREQQEDLETQRREITITFDDVMRQREAEFKQTVDELQTKTRELELKLKSTQRESEMAKERCEALKIKMENMQQLLNESEKEAKAMEWQAADVRASKDAKINELEDEILKLQDIKQSLLDEYEGKMAELLQSLHSVEKAFVLQKAQYDEELQRQMRKKDDDTQNMTLRMDAKVQSLMAKLRTTEEQAEKLQAEMKQLTWESEDKLMEKDREIDRLKQEVGDVSDQKQGIIAEMKQQLWTAERETLSLQEKLKDAVQQLQIHKEKDKMHRQELAETMEKHEDLKRELVTVNLRWENKYQELEQEMSARHDSRVRELQQARERLMTEKQATEDRLIHSENELHRLRSEIHTLQSDARISASFGSQFGASRGQQKQQQMQRSREDAALSSFPAPSPLWSDDNGTLSPIAGMSPLLTDSPQRVVAERVSGSGGHSTSGPANTAMMESLQSENVKLKELIHQMRDALTQQAQDLSSAASPERGDANVIARLQLAEKQCVLLEAKLQETESKLASQNGTNAAVAVSETLTLCQAELIQAKRSIEEKNNRIAELERQVEVLQQQQQPQSSSTGADQVIAGAEVSDLKRKLSSAHGDIERLVKERTQLMELSNKLTAELRKLKESSPGGASSGGVEFSGKKDYENLIADLSRSLEESRLHNKTLKKELRRMVKLHVVQGQQGGGDSGREDDDQALGARSRATSIASTVADGGDRRRPSTLSMMRALETSATQDSRRSSVASNVSSNAPSSLFDEELLSLVRNKVTSPSSSVSLSRASIKLPQKRSSAVIPPSIPEDAEDEGEEDENEDDNGASQSGTLQPASSSSGLGGERSSLSMLFSRDRQDSIVSGASESAPVSDARTRLQQAKEMLLLAGKKAERSASLAAASGSSVSFAVVPKSSDRATASQKSAIKKLKELQTKRAEMVTERKKVRNYSMAT